MIWRTDALLLGVIVLGFTVGAAWRLNAGPEPERELARELAELRRWTSELVGPHSKFTAAVRPDRGASRLRIVPLDDLLTPTTHHLPPYPPGKWPADKNGHGFASNDGARTLPFGTLDELIETLRHVDAGGWADDAMVFALGPQTVALWQRPATADAIVAFLDRKIRPHAHRSVLLETDLFELDAELARRVRTAGGNELDRATLDAIASALDAGGAKRIFASRALSLLGQRSLLWQGTQRAHVRDADVEVAQSARTSDPKIEILQTGGSVSARIEARRDGQRVSIDLDFGHSVAGQTETRDTVDASRLQLPRWRFTRARTGLDLRSGEWGVAVLADGGHGRARALLIRATVLERTGGLR